MNELLLGVDENLRAAWFVLSRFCALVNLGSQTGRRVPLQVISDAMASVMYRLIHMPHAAGSLDGIIRLGLLTFSYGTFIKWKDIKLPQQHLRDSYRQSIEKAKLANKVEPAFLLWMLMIGALTIFSDEPWLKDSLSQYAIVCRTFTWTDMHSLLKSFMWIDILDDQPGRSIFNMLELTKSLVIAA